MTRVRPVADRGGGTCKDVGDIDDRAGQRIVERAMRSRQPNKHQALGHALPQRKIAGLGEMVMDRLDLSEKKRGVRELFVKPVTIGVTGSNRVGKEK